MDADSGTRGFIGRLDRWLWKTGLRAAPVRAVLRNEILACGVAAIAGLALLPLGLWAISFALGLGLTAWIFGGWARFFSGARLSDGFSGAFLRAILFGWGTRLALFCVILYLALALLRASAIAVIAGMACGLGLGLLSYAGSMHKNK